MWDLSRGETEQPRPGVQPLPCSVTSQQPHSVIQRRLVEGSQSRPAGESPLAQALTHSQESRRRPSKTERLALLVNCKVRHPTTPRGLAPLTHSPFCPGGGGGGVGIEGNPPAPTQPQPTGILQAFCFHLTRLPTMQLHLSQPDSLSLIKLETIPECAPSTRGGVCTCALPGKLTSPKVTALSFPEPMLSHSRSMSAPLCRPLLSFLCLLSSS